jgi:hypothetical protein
VLESATTPPQLCDAKVHGANRGRFDESITAKGACLRQSMSLRRRRSTRWRISGTDQLRSRSSAQAVSAVSQFAGCVGLHGRLMVASRS